MVRLVSLAFILFLLTVGLISCTQDSSPQVRTHYYVVKYRPAAAVNCPQHIARSGILWGIWQAFAEYQTSPWQIKLGRQQYRSGLGYLVDFRFDGILVSKKCGKTLSHLFLGVVPNDIGTKGFFCARDLLVNDEARRMCVRQLCNARYGENGLIAFAADFRRYRLTVARQWARVPDFEEYVIAGLVNLQLLKNLWLVSEPTLRYGLSDAKLYHTVISYLNYRQTLLQAYLGWLVSNKSALLSPNGFGQRMRYGPLDKSVGFLQLVILPNKPIHYQIGYYQRVTNQYQTQNNELDLGVIIRQFSRAQIFISSALVDFLKANRIIESSIEVLYVL